MNPAPPTASRPRLPVTVLSRLLGTGKPPRLNQVLNNRQGRRLRQQPGVAKAPEPVHGAAHGLGVGVNGTLKRTLPSVSVALLVLAGCAPSRQVPSSHPDPGGDGDVNRRAMDHRFESPEAFASEWNDASRDAWQKPQEILTALGLTEGGRVADLGAGTGYLIEFLRSVVGPSGQVLALDVEAAMVTYLDEQRLEAGWDNVEVRQSAHDDPTLSPGSVDAVVTLNTWHHVSERTEFARRVRTGLAEGGRFVIVDFITEPTEGHGPPMEMRLAPDLVVAELEAAGFSATVIEETLPRHYIVVATRPDSGPSLQP